MVRDMGAEGNKPLKVCLVCHGLGCGGIESFIVSLATGLKDRGFDVKLAMALDDNGISQFREKEIADAGIEMFRTCDQGSVKRICTHLLRLFRYLKCNDFDVVHSNMNRLNGLNLAVAWLAGVKVRVAHSHALVGSEGDLDNRNRLRNIYIYIYRIITNFAVMIFANRKCGCSSLATQFAYGEKSLGTRNTYVIYNGISLNKFVSDRLCCTGGKRLITVGRLVPIKNPNLILEIMCALKEKGYTLMWVGGGNLEDQIRAKVHELGLSDCVSMLGVRNDVDLLLRNADLFLLPSLMEGLSIATIEAQAAGLPCVVSDGVPNEVDCGLCEFVPIRASAEKWAETIELIISGETTLKLDRNKLNRFNEEYTVEQTIAMYYGR